jgi:hypothetical protein
MPARVFYFRCNFFRAKSEETAERAEMWASANQGERRAINWKMWEK